MSPPKYYLNEPTEEEVKRHASKKLKQKEFRDRMLSEKTEVARGLVMVNTGKGKGKTTAAMGLALRFIGCGKRVAIVQFVKGAWDTGERHALEQFGDKVSLHVLGEGFTWDTQDLRRDLNASAKAWEKARELIKAGKDDLLILDELNISLRQGYLDPLDVASTIKAKPPAMTIMVTGRNAPAELLEVADTVTDMQDVKHHFRQGVRAQRGIEY